MLAEKDLWCGHSVLVVDGTTVVAADTLENQKAFPQQSVQKPGCGFPILRVVGLMSLATGMLVAWAVGPWRSHELGLLQTLWDVLQPGHVLLGDRGFCSWGLLAQCHRRNVQAVFRVRGKLRADFRRTFRNLKTTLQMEHLGCKTPENLERELRGQSRSESTL